MKFDMLRTSYFTVKDEVAFKKWFNGLEGAVDPDASRVVGHRASTFLLRGVTDHDTEYSQNGDFLIRPIGEDILYCIVSDCALQYRIGSDGEEYRCDFIEELRGHLADKELAAVIEINCRSLNSFVGTSTVISPTEGIVYFSRLSPDPDELYIASATHYGIIGLD